MVYSMHRTQLYLEDDVWSALQIRSRESGDSMSELVRAALRDKYLDSSANRMRALNAIIGIWKDRTDLPDTDDYIRSMRQDTRSIRFEAGTGDDTPE